MSGRRRIVAVITVCGLAVLGSAEADPAAAAAGSTVRVSVTSSGHQGRFQLRSFQPAVSANGRYVAFSSEDALAGRDTNGGWSDVYVRDLVARRTSLVGLGSDGRQPALGTSQPSISGDGRFVAFISDSPLAADDRNGVSDVYLRDRVTGATRRVSASRPGGEAAGSYLPSVSADGRRVAFFSFGLFGQPGSGFGDAYLRDMTTGRTYPISVDSAGQPRGGGGGGDGPVISDDGRRVSFGSLAPLVAGDTNRTSDVFVRDWARGTTIRVSVGAGARPGGDASSPAISVTGRYVSFSTPAPLVAEDTNSDYDVYLRDTVAGTTTRISVTADERQADGPSFESAVSRDGRYVSFTSRAPDLGAHPGNGNSVFLRDRVAGTTDLVSVNATGISNNGGCYELDMSADGATTGYYSEATNLVPGDTNREFDVFAFLRR